jgi:hypothetical protein
MGQRKRAGVGGSDRQLGAALRLIRRRPRRAALLMSSPFRPRAARPGLHDTIGNTRGAPRWAPGPWAAATAPPTARWRQAAADSAMASSRPPAAWTTPRSAPTLAAAFISIAGRARCGGAPAMPGARRGRPEAPRAASGPGGAGGARAQAGGRRGQRRCARARADQAWGVRRGGAAPAQGAPGVAEVRWGRPAAAARADRALVAPSTRARPTKRAGHWRSRTALSLMAPPRRRAGGRERAPRRAARAAAAPLPPPRAATHATPQTGRRALHGTRTGPRRGGLASYANVQVWPPRACAGPRAARAHAWARPPRRAAVGRARRAARASPHRGRSAVQHEPCRAHASARR